jgi:hypothetical protein
LQGELPYGHFESAISSLIRNVYVAYAANCRLNAFHNHLSTYEKIKDFEKLSLFGKMYAISLVRSGSYSITADEVNLGYGNDVWFAQEIRVTLAAGAVLEVAWAFLLWSGIARYGLDKLMVNWGFALEASLLCPGKP